MITTDALLEDGRSALDDLQGASPGGGFVTSQSRPRAQLAPGDIVRWCGTWTVVAAISHNGVTGLSRAALVTAAGELTRNTLTHGEGMDTRTDARIDPDTLYKLMPRDPGADMPLRPGREEQAVGLAAEIARLPLAGEDRAGMPQDGDGAREALASLVRQARAILSAQPEGPGTEGDCEAGGAPAGPPLWTSPEQLAAAGGYIAREWGDHGYRIEGITSPTRLVSVFRVAAADGARFAVAADRYGNCADLSDDSSGWPAVITGMHQAAATP